MTLRLVLISLVAGLGLGLPSWPTIEGWVAGAQKWMNARLAAADDREGERHVVIHDLLAAEMERAHAARQARRAAAASPLAPRPALIAVAHSTAPRRPAAAATPAAPSLPIPLPKLDDFLAAAATAPVPAPEAPTLAVARPDDLAVLAWGRIRPGASRLAAAMAAGLREAAGRDRDARAFVAMEGSDDLYFDAAVPAEPAPLPAEAVAAVEGPEPLAIEGPAPEALAVEPAPLPDFDAMERSADLYFAAPIVDESAPAPEAMLAEAPEPAAIEEALGLAELPADVFAPVEAGPVVAVVVAPEPTPASPEVNRAVRLTGEALSAWINVLTGPALVTASHGGAVAR
ncbi:MAG: hypothetical protein BGO49_07380 [Planctomycetales bacterium 71-10]|nr:MAG: hypothetical protein BGO49_07380 [Planctomycetales bacterium 71-10]